jgi:hypothetical protein
MGKWERVCSQLYISDVSKDAGDRLLETSPFFSPIRAMSESEDDRTQL